MSYAGQHLTLQGYRNLHIAGAKYQDISFGNLFFNPDNGDVLICDNDNVSYGNNEAGRSSWYTGIWHLKL